MTTPGYIYCGLLAVCNFLIFRTVFTFGVKQTLLQGFRSPAIRLAVFGGAVVTLVGSIAHRTSGFNPDVRNPWAWVIVFGVPLVLGFLSRAALDPGWTSLQRGKALWQDLIPVEVGTVVAEASRYRDHPKVHTARDLIHAAIDHAPASNVQSSAAIANAAIAWQELGLLHRCINDFVEARRCFERSLTLSRDAHDHPKILAAKRDTLFRLAELDHVTGRREQARRGYEQSLEIDAQLGHDDPIGEATTRDLLSRL
jgi:tetratricopeptide (TPR) repeat protein